MHPPAGDGHEILGVIVEIGEALELCARGVVCPLVTYSLDEADTVLERLEAEAITGRAAIVI